MVTVLLASRTVPPLAISEYAFALAWPWAARTASRAAVRVVLPWSMCPIVPTLTCGFVLAKVSLAIVAPVVSWKPRAWWRVHRGRPESKPTIRWATGRWGDRLSKPRDAPDPPGRRGRGPESCRWDLNPGPRPYQGRALPTEPRQHVIRVDSGRSLGGPDPPRSPPAASSRRPPRRPRAGDGNRTHVACLEGRYSTIELHPRGTSSPGRVGDRSADGGSEVRRGAGSRRVAVRFGLNSSKGASPGRRGMGGAGFEPAKAMPPDLQSGPFSHLGIHPVSDDPSRCRSSRPVTPSAEGRGPIRQDQSWR